MNGEAFPGDPRERSVLYAGILQLQNLHFAVDQLGNLVEITVGSLHAVYSTEELLIIGRENDFIDGIKPVIGYLAYEPQIADENWHRPFDDELRNYLESE